MGTKLDGFALEKTAVFEHLQGRQDRTCARALAALVALLEGPHDVPAVRRPLAARFQKEILDVATPHPPLAPTHGLRNCPNHPDTLAPHISVRIPQSPYQDGPLHATALPDSPAFSIFRMEAITICLPSTKSHRSLNE